MRPPFRSVPPGGLSARRPSVPLPPGSSPEEAIAEFLADDAQVRAATFTGKEHGPYAGDRSGRSFVV